ncbi:ferredoxin [bacterium]|nr:ferredoxin [bacterium]
MKIIHERSKCIGCGACANICPNYFEMKEDGKSALKGGQEKEKEIYELEIEEAGCAKNAADSCPVQCIRIQE